MFKKLREFKWPDLQIRKNLLLYIFYGLALISLVVSLMVSVILAQIL